MVILFAQYALFMCLAIISNKSSCDQKLIEASSGSGVYWNAACTAKCMVFEKYKTFENCIDYCQSEDSPNDEEVLRKINENHDLLLLCRDDRSITLMIVLPPNGYTGRQKRSDVAIQKSNKMQLTNITHIQEIYVINVSLANEPKHISVYMSNENLITIGNLSQHTTYNVSVAVVYSSDEYSIIAKGRQFMTLRRGYKPKEIQEISLVGFASDETNEMRLTAFISWKPSYDMTCWYDIVCFSPERVDMELTPIEIRDPHGLFTYSLDNLTFSTVYHVGIRAMNTNDTSKESAMKWEIITTPPCIEWHNNNFNICAPLKPEGLSVKEHFLLHNDFSLNVSWQHPLHEPDYYTLKILDLDQLHTFDVKKYEYNVAKEQSWYFIPNLTLSGMLFEVHLTAHTPGGSSTAFVTQPTNKPHQVSVFPDRNYILKFGIAILAPIFGIAILSLTIFVVCHRRAKLKRFKERCKYFQELEKKAPIDPKSTFDFPTKTLTVPPAPDDILKYQLDLEEKLFFNDDMEINRSNVELYEVLGEGAFGLVRRGIFHDNKKDGDNNIREVAAKMLKDQPSVDDVRAFRREIEVMKSVGRHPNIVGIIGHCTRKYNEMLLLTEYCSLGNLLNFLRSEWKYLHELSFRNDSDHSKSLYKRSSMATMKEKTVQKPTENLNNFDSRIVDKIKLRYKHLNPSYDTSTSAYFRSLRSGASSMLPSTSPPPPPSPPQAISFHSKSNVSQFNKSYGYEEICTNACKCRVDILPDDTNPLGENNKKNNSKSGAQIKISRKCECRHKRSSLPSIENKGYYKNLFCFSSLKDGGKEQQRPVANKNTKDSIEAGREPLSGADLLEIAKQVAMGMEFLSKNKVVHRDLAARNVLVSSDRTVKIADFGLSRDVYQENVYKKTGNGKLPIKWLAIESMTHQVYTSQSDVWSFGILLYEITTLGGTPYPSIPTNRLLHLLKTGYRMEKPKNCGQGFYNLMTSCWCFNPAERPNFTEIIKILDSLLSESPQLPIDELNSPKPADSPDTPTSSESYLKPL